MHKHNQKRVVVIGGGTGMPVLLRGLKNMPIDLTALVSVADDGGSTGRLRNDMEIPAPGDIRNVIAALSEAEPLFIELFQHRFSEGNGLSSHFGKKSDLSGHSMGNLLLAAMTSLTGDFNTGIKEISRIFNVKGEIYPISNESMSLNAEMEDGTIVSGESKIPLANKRIKKVFLTTQPIKPLPNAIEAIENADLIVISPGSLYTSILSNLIIPHIGDAIRNTKGKVVYVCNVMTQAGETTGYTASDHVQAINDHIGSGCVDSIVLHNQSIRHAISDVYAIKHAEPVIYDIDQLEKLELEIIRENIIDYTETTVTHNRKRVANLLYSLIESNS